MARGLKRYGGIESWLQGMRERSLIAFADFGGRTLGTTTEGIGIGLANFADGSGIMSIIGIAGGAVTLSSGATGDSQSTVQTENLCVVPNLNPHFAMWADAPAGSSSLKVWGAGFFVDPDCSDWTTATQSKSCFRRVTTGNFEAVTSGGSAETVTDLSSLIANGDRAFFEIRVSADGATVTFLINDVVVATHTTNVPIGALFMKMGVGIENNTTSAQIFFGLDMIAVDQERLPQE